MQVNIARGVDHIKTRSTERAGLPEQDPRVQVYDERQIRAVVNAARRLRGGVMCHGHGDEGIRDSVRAGVRSVEHGTFASTATLDLDAGARDVPRPDPVGRRRPRRAGRGIHRPTARRPRAEMLAQLRITVPAARARGIPIVAGTDTSYTAAVTVQRRRRGPAARAVRAPGLDALRAATTTAASLVGLERELGRLKPGYAADALVVARTRSAISPRSTPSASSSRAAGSRTRRPERCS